MDNNEYDSLHFESFIIKDDEEIYNPIFDEFKPEKPIELDLEDYIPVKKQIMERVEKNRININLAKLIHHNETPSSFQFQTAINPFTYANQIKLPKVKVKKQIKLTPFQRIQYLMDKERNEINSRRRIKSNVQLMLTGKPNNDNPIQLKKNEEKKQKLKLKLIGTYCSFFYNKKEIEKVEKKRNESLNNTRNINNQKVCFCIDNDNKKIMTPRNFCFTPTSRLSNPRTVGKSFFNPTYLRNYIL